MTTFLGQVPRVLGTVARNRELRRVQLAFAGFNGAEWGVWIAMLVYAYGQGGATTAGLVALAQLVPAGLFAPFASVLADRHPPARVLALGYVAQAAAMGATGAVLFADGPAFVAYALAAVANTAVTVTRPTQAALVPALVRSPDELTASNVVSGWVESVSVLAAPALTGVLLAVSEPGAVFAVMALAGIASAALVGPIAGPPAAGAGGGAGALAAAAAGFQALRREPDARVLAGLLGTQYVVIGALDVLFVVLAVSVLELGDPGAGYLNAAFGAGGVVGIAVTAALVGRGRLAPPLVAAMLVWWAAFAFIGLDPSTAGAFLLLAAAGAGRALFDVAGRTLLQRTAPGDVLARVFGVVESLAMAGMAVGSLLAPALVALGGASLAFLGAGALLPLVALVSGRRLLRIDRAATVPVVEVALLRSVPMLSMLRPPELERLARGLVAVGVPPGEAVVREGERGDRFYVVADGELDVTQAGRTVRTLVRGDCFGEIALLRDVPRTATVTARTAARVHALARAPFLAAVAGSPQAAREADRLVEERLGGVPSVAAGRIAP